MYYWKILTELMDYLEDRNNELDNWRSFRNTNRRENGREYGKKLLCGDLDAGQLQRTHIGHRPLYRICPSEQQVQLPTIHRLLVCSAPITQVATRSTRTSIQRRVIVSFVERGGIPQCRHYMYLSSRPKLQLRCNMYSRTDSTDRSNQNSSNVLSYADMHCFRVSRMH